MKRFIINRQSMMGKPTHFCTQHQSLGFKIRTALVQGVDETITSQKVYDENDTGIDPMSNIRHDPWSAIEAKQRDAVAKSMRTQEPDVKAPVDTNVDSTPAVDPTITE